MSGTGKMSGTGNKDVGYKKPPKSGQFKKGQSGNPSGRKKRKDKHKLEDPNHTLAFLLAGKVSVTVGGKSTLMSRQEAIDLALISKAIGGNVQAIKLLHEKMNQMPPGYKNREAVWYRPTEQDETIRQEFLEDARKYCEAEEEVQQLRKEAFELMLKKEKEELQKQESQKD